MDQLQNEIAEVSRQLQKVMTDTEANINVTLSATNDKFEKTMKSYIDKVLSEHLDTLFQNMKAEVLLQATPPDCNALSTNFKNSATQTNDIEIDNNQVGRHQATQTINTQSTDSQSTQTVAVNTVPVLSKNDTSRSTSTVPPGRLRAANGTNQGKHHVFIGNMHPTTTNDDVRAHLMDVDVLSIVNISKLEGDPGTASFHVVINDDTIKHNVYEPANFHNGIIVEPFRDYKRKTSRKLHDADHMQQRDSTQSVALQNSRDRQQNSRVNDTWNDRNNSRKKSHNDTENNQTTPVQHNAVAAPQYYQLPTYHYPVQPMQQMQPAQAIQPMQPVQPGYHQVYSTLPTSQPYPDKVNSGNIPRQPVAQFSTPDRAYPTAQTPHPITYTGYAHVPSTHDLSLSKTQSLQPNQPNSHNQHF